MKLFKLSLAAVMAAGALATTASAIPLEEAIKDVDVSGMVRVRYHSVTNKNEGADKNNSTDWNFKTTTDFKVKIDDNFYALVGLRYTDTDGASSSSTAFDKSIVDPDKNNLVDNKSDFGVYRLLFGYKVGGTDIMVGRYGLGTFFSDDMYGDGVKIVNTDIEGLVLAALWADALEADGDISSLQTINYGMGAKVDGKNVTDHNLYGVAAIGAYDPVSFQFWYASLQDVVDLFAVEVGLKFQLSDDVTLGLKGQYVYSNFDDAYIATGLIDDANFYAGEASLAFYGVDLAGGYLAYNSDDDNKYSLVTLEDQGSLIWPGQQAIDYALFKGDNHFWFVKAGYTIPDTGLRIGVDYLQGETSSHGKIDADTYEVVGRLNYQYNEKLSFAGWYSHLDVDGVKEKDKIRLEAKYKF